MNSTRERAITALFNYLREQLPNITVLRNAVLPTHIPENGLIILRDGEPGEPDIVLSPPRYTYHHQVELEVIVQQADDEQREQQSDKLLVIIGNALQSANTLQGAVDYLTTHSPTGSTEPIEGGTTIKLITLPITLEYVVVHPLL